MPHVLLGLPAEINRRSYLPDINESVTVWIDQDHSSSGSGTNEIMIAVGQIDNDTLPEPTSTGLFSSVPPGVACLENFSGTLDCVLLFVPMSDTGNDIVARRFSVTAGSNRYSIGWNLNSNYALPLGSRTPTSIAVWYSQSNSKFYAAWKSSTQGGDIEVASSTDGATWSMVTYGLAWSAAGPSAASMWRGNDNTIVIAE